MYSFASGTIVSAGTCSPSLPGTQPVSLNISPAPFRRAISSLVMTFFIYGLSMPRPSSRDGLTKMQPFRQHRTKSIPDTRYLPPELGGAFQRGGKLWTRLSRALFWPKKTRLFAANGYDPPCVVL